ncbi:MAG: L-asparagine transporter-like permease [Planctomycetota bacterium]|jgi:L-asparagine transporter-like permease
MKIGEKEFIDRNKKYFSGYLNPEDHLNKKEKHYYSFFKICAYIGLLLIATVFFLTLIERGESIAVILFLLSIPFLMLGSFENTIRRFMGHRSNRKK